MIAYSTFIEYNKREQIFAKTFSSNGVETVSEFKVSDGNNRTDTISGIVSIENNGSEAVGFLHTLATMRQHGRKPVINCCRH